LPIKISEVSFSYNEKKVLHDISLIIPDGAYYGITGPNGSGKTTLAYLIAGILKPEKGCIDLSGSKIGLILSNPENQIVSLLVEEDIAFGPENLRLATDDILRQVTNALSLAGASNLRNSLTANLSGGELAKIAFAGQLAMQADVIILDEGIVHLDSHEKTALLDILETLNRDKGKTIIHITHHLDDLEPATDVSCLVDGRIVLSAPEIMSFLEKSKDILPDISPGHRLLYKKFISEIGIEASSLKDATNRLAEKLRKKSEE
jgi:energy-coupling factor transporter ATP-binding protein EcfA2